MTAQRVISADSHLTEPGDLWLERLDRKYRDSAPRVIKNDKPTGAAYLFVGPGIHPLTVAGVFAAGTPQAADLFFSRRIGIDENGAPVPIIGGGRVTGKMAGVTVGMLQIFTDDVDSVSGNSYSVARITREFAGRSRGP